MLEMLRDPGRSLVHLVTLPEELPVRETCELADQIQGELGIPLGTCFINKVWETHVDPELRAWLRTQNAGSSQKNEDHSALVQYLCRSLARQEHQARHIAEIRTALDGLSFNEIPYISKATLERSDLEAFEPGIFSVA